MQHFITIFCWDYLESIFLGRLGKDHPSHSIEDQTPLCLTGRNFFIYWWWVGLGGLRDKTKGEPQGWRGVAGRRPHRHLGYSATVFISGTRFFIDPPALPRVEGRSRSWIKKAFMLERVLGALISVLFFVAINGTIVRAS